MKMGKLANYVADQSGIENEKSRSFGQKKAYSFVDVSTVGAVDVAIGATAAVVVYEVGKRVLGFLYDEVGKPALGYILETDRVRNLVDSIEDGQKRFEK